MPNIGLALLGGGFAAAYQVGLATCLWARGKKPKKIQGVSAGALNAAKLVESGPDELRKTWLKIEEEGPEIIFHSHIVSAFIRKLDYIYSGEGLEKLVRENIDMAMVLASDIELEVVTWNRSKRRSEIFSNKPLDGFDSEGSGNKNIIRHTVTDPEIMRKAVVASASLRGFFPSVAINGDNYTDGYRMELETFADTCDIVFLLNNDQATMSSDPEDGRVKRVIREFVGNFCDILDDLIDTRVELFQERHPDFDTKIDSPIDFLKRLFREVTGSAKQLLVLSPFYQIPSLRLDRFNKQGGDISRAIAQSIGQAQVHLDKLGL